MLYLYCVGIFHLFVYDIELQTVFENTKKSHIYISLDEIGDFPIYSTSLTSCSLYIGGPPRILVPEEDDVVLYMIETAEACRKSKLNG